MISCLYPDCQTAWAPSDAVSVEACKRNIIAHINNEHAEAHVLIACKHELKHVEDFNIVVNPQDGRGSYDEANRRYQCVRCGDFVVSAVPQDQIPEGAGGILSTEKIVE